MKNDLRILMLEDNEADGEMISELLLEAIPGCQFKIVKGKGVYITALREFKPDVILSDSSITQFTAAEALEIKKGMQSEIPFIMVSGTSSKEFEASMILKGADDYVLKDNIAILPAAIETAIKHKEIEREKLEAERKKITRAILIAGEKERNRLSRELHDNINQLLATAKLYLGTAARDNPVFKEKIKYPLELIDQSMEELRSLSHRMGSPLKDIDLRSMIETLLVKIGQSSPIETHLQFSLPSLVLEDDLKLNIFRIVQEQTHNILKYARARNIDIFLTEKNGILNIIIKDDGEGFDINVKRSGIGISNIQHRVTSFNGEMEIISSPGKGCSIIIKIPAG